MKFVGIAAAMFAFAASSPGVAAPTEKSGTYREAVLCSGLLGATSAYLETQGGESAEQAQYSASLQKRWVARAIDLAPDAGRVMDDVGASSKYYVQLFGQLENANNSELDARLGPDMDRCLTGGGELPEAK